MKRRYRLSDRERFRQVRREGRSWSLPLVVLCALPNELPYSRFGFVVGRKLGSAVQRNRVRRRLRESIRLMQPQIASGWDLVFIARPAIAQASYREIAATCARLLRRAQLLTAGSPASLTGDPAAAARDEPL